MVGESGSGAPLWNHHKKRIHNQGKGAGAGREDQCQGGENTTEGGRAQDSGCIRSSGNKVLQILLVLGLRHC